MSNDLAKSPGNSEVEEKDTSVSSTLIRGLNILNCFQTGGETLTNAEIALRLGINKATVSRLCKTLIAEKFLRRDPAGGFRLAPRVLALSYPLLASMKWRQQAVGMMAEIAEFAKGNVSMAVFAGGDSVFIQTVGEPTNYPHVPEMGMTMPLPETSNGRALLSMLSDQELADKYAEIREVYPESLEENQARIDEAILSCKTRGFCISYGDWRENVYGTAAPIGRTADNLCVSLLCGVPAYRARKEELENDLGPRLVSVAQNLRLFNIFQS